MKRTAKIEHASLTRFDWRQVGEQVSEHGAAVLQGLIPAQSCKQIAALYDQTPLFRSHINMTRHGFGRGEYRYFAYPLPAWLATLRAELYARLVPIANQWADQLGYERSFPDSHERYIERCHAAGQLRPTPLLLRYVAGDYNCLHQDLYGAEWFPLQVVVLLSAPGEDFDGGEFLIVEQRPRAQSKGSVIALKQGDAAVIAVNHRPRRSALGYSRVTLRHGVSPLTAGRRHTLGIVFHDAA
ncbi:MAG TPA: 2OG-Fe(II) oxygenase [Steroidobacter sp.]